MTTTLLTFEVPAPEPSSPDEAPGRVLTERLVDALRTSRVSVARPVTEHNAYGWAFDIEHGGARVRCILQRSDAWLIVVDLRLSLVDRFFGQTHWKAREEVLQALEKALRDLGVTGRVRRYTPEWFAARSKQPAGLISVLLDPSADEGSRDDAAMDLGDFDEPEAEEALLRIVLDLSADENLADSAGESVLQIWKRSGKFDADVVARMHPYARRNFQ